MTLSEGKLRRMKALANNRGVIAAAAMDQRGSLQKSLASARGVDSKSITPEMMSEFKVIVSKVLTPHASAILLDPEFGLEAAAARSKNAGLLLAYELSGYDNTQPGRLPDLLPHVSVKRIVDWGADAVKILIYYTHLRRSCRSTISSTPSSSASARSARHTKSHSSWSSSATIPRAATKRASSTRKHQAGNCQASMEEFSKPQYKVDVLKVEVPVNAEYVEGSSVYKGQKAYTRAEALAHFRESAAVGQ